MKQYKVTVRDRLALWVMGLGRQIATPEYRGYVDAVSLLGRQRFAEKFDELSAERQ